MKVQTHVHSDCSLFLQIRWPERHEEKRIFALGGMNESLTLAKKKSLSETGTRIDALSDD